MTKGRKFLLYLVSILLIVEAGVFGSLPFVRSGLLAFLEPRFPKARVWFGEPEPTRIITTITVDSGFPSLWDNETGEWNRNQKITTDFIAFANSVAPEGSNFNGLIQHGNIVLVEWQEPSVPGFPRGPVFDYLFVYTEGSGWKLVSSFCEAHCSRGR